MGAEYARIATVNKDGLVAFSLFFPTRGQTQSLKELFIPKASLRRKHQKVLEDFGKCNHNKWLKDSFSASGHEHSHVCAGPFSRAVPQESHFKIF